MSLLFSVLSALSQDKACLICEKLSSLVSLTFSDVRTLVLLLCETRLSIIIKRLSSKYGLSCLNSYAFFFVSKDFIYLYLESGERREKEWERNIDV